MDAQAWQRRGDDQQTSYLPDREERFAALLDVVEVACGSAPLVLDLAGGTGSLSRRLLARLPKVRSVVADVDPVLLELARRTFEGDDEVGLAWRGLGDALVVGRRG